MRSRWRFVVLAFLGVFGASCGSGEPNDPAGNGGTNAAGGAAGNGDASGAGGRGTANVSAIAVGYRHTCAIVNGGVQCWGMGRSGQLGNNTMVSSSIPVAVVGLGPSSGVSAIAAGETHTCAIVNGGVKCWGDNEEQQIGGTLAAGTLNGSWVPVDIVGLDPTSGVVAIAAGEFHTCVLMSSGGVKCWGGGGWGQLGDSRAANSPTPVDVVGLGPGSNVTAIATGSDQSCAIVGGTLMCWGRNDFGDVGDSSLVQSNVPVAVVGLGSGVRAVGCGGGFTCAIDGDAVRCWGGEGGYGGLGNNTAGSGSGMSTIPVSVMGLDPADVSMIALGWFHACAVVLSGLQCWGNNLEGELGNGNAIISGIPVQVSGLASMSGVKRVGAGVMHTCALVNDEVLCWGYNEFGQLGDGTTDPHYTPLPVASWAK